MRKNVKMVLISSWKRNLEKTIIIATLNTRYKKVYYHESLCPHSVVGSLPTLGCAHLHGQ